MFSLHKFINLSAFNSAVSLAPKIMVNRLFLQANRKTRIVTVSALFLTIFAIGAAGVVPLAPDASDLPVKRVVESLRLPNLAEQIDALEQTNQHFIHEEKVQRGDTLASILQRLGVDDDDAANFIKSNQTARLVLQQKTGKTIRAKTNEDGQLEWLQTNLNDPRDNNVNSLTITRIVGSHPDAAHLPNMFFANTATTPLERRVEMHSGVINSSLFAATDAAQIPDNVASQLVEMFSTDIDFRTDLRRGDHFELMYETFWQNGEMVSSGRVLAGEFTNGSRVYQSVWYADADGKGGSYYSFDGKSLKKAFLKSPLAFTRISSVFSMRIHPISGQWKQHTGVDFAAPTGTPIRATADGVIDVASSTGGYGNLVVIKHWNNYSTYYGHMSRFAAGMRKGTKVQQGDVIGYVGSTGWATGPHLHYEFRVANKAQDPLKIKVEQGQTLTAADMPRFNATVQDVRHRFGLLYPADIKVATK